MFLNIKITGSGRIPRLGGLAPRMTPTKANWDLITIIMNTPGLGIRYYNPEVDQWAPLNRKNMKLVWDKYSNWDYFTKKAPTQTSPVVPDAPIPQAKTVEVKEEVKVNNNTVTEKVEVKEEKVESVKKEEKKTIQPIYKDDTETSTNKIDIPDVDIPLNNKKGNENNKKK